jgi:adenylyltransferase/sulfurtransferase
VTPLVGNVLSDVGLGYFRWAHVVVGAVDNREARVFVNRACAQVGRPWIDGGIEVLSGIVRGFAPPATACYECTMGQADWDLLAKRRSCSLLARRAMVEGGAPTTPTTASIIAGIQAQEAVKRLHGLDSLAGRGFIFEGLTHHSYTVDYPILEGCRWHEAPAPIEAVAEWGSDTPLREIRDGAAARLGGLDAIDLARELVEDLECPSCGRHKRILQPVDRIREDQALCEACGAECAPRFLHSLGADSGLLDLTAGQLGLPAWDVLWARRGEATLGIELAADRERSLRRVAQA